MKIEIISEISDERWGQFSVDEFMINFTANIRISELSYESIVIEEVPVLWIVRGLLESTIKVVKTNLSDTLRDFYGEFSFVLCKKESQIEIGDTNTDVYVETSVDEFVRATEVLLNDTLQKFRVQFPGIADDPKFKQISFELHGCLDQLRS